MKVYLRSHDPRVQTAIQAVFEDFNPALSVEATDDCRLDGRLILWDYEPGDEIPRPADSSITPIVFLVRRQHLAQLQDQLRGAPASILLKPLVEATLKSMVKQYQHASKNATGRQDLLQYMLQMNLMLQKFDQDRTNFLARAVHDFRAPLTALQGYCGLMLQQQLGPLNAGQMQLLERMQHSAKRLTRMASAMFELSVGKQVERKPHLETVEIEGCVQHALHDIRPLANEKQIGVSVHLRPAAATARWEGAQIEQVLVNLLENACKFTPRFGSIEVRGYPAPMHTPHSETKPNGALHAGNVPAYRFDVRDTGPGIPPEFLPLIFEEYTSYSGGQDRSGGGLGLAICRMIVNAHGGRIWAESSERGTTFSFTLPLSETIFHTANVPQTESHRAGTVA